MGKVKFKLSDGKTPEKADGTVKVYAPMDLTLLSGDKLSVGVGVSFSVPVLLLENPYMKKQGLVLANAGTIVFPGTEAVANISLESDDALELSRGQTLLFALPLESNFKLEQE